MTRVGEGANARGVYARDLAGKLTRLTLGNNSYSDYLYDAAGSLTVVCNNKSDDTDISKFAYLLDAAGVRTKMDITGLAYATAAVAYLYDGAYQLTKETRSSGSAYTLSFWYDSAGNRTKKDLGGTGTTYYYDYIDRMTESA